MTYDFPTHVDGDTFDGVRFTVKANGSPVDLTDATIDMNMEVLSSIRTFSTSGSQLAIQTPPTDGIFEFSKQIVSVGVFGTFPYEIIFYLRNGDVKTYLKGNWTITR